MWKSCEVLLISFVSKNESELNHYFGKVSDCLDRLETYGAMDRLHKMHFVLTKPAAKELQLSQEYIAHAIVLNPKNRMGGDEKKHVQGEWAFIKKHAEHSRVILDKLASRDQFVSDVAEALSRCISEMPNTHSASDIDHYAAFVEWWANNTYTRQTSEKTNGIFPQGRKNNEKNVLNRSPKLKLKLA